MDNLQKDFDLVFYGITQGEITRYRDREWIIPGLFIVALVGTIQFMLTNNQYVEGQKFAFLLFLLSLATGNWFYLYITHVKLTKQRDILTILQYRLKQSGAIDDSFPYSTRFKTEAEIHKENWNRGFYSHILVFGISGTILLIFGVSLLF